MIDVEGYTDLRPIGSGGLSEVFRARQVSTGGTVAIKVLHGVAPSSTAARRRARREFAALSSLDGHPHVIGVIEMIDTTAGPAIVLEHAPGGSVAAMIARRCPLSVAEAVLVGRHTAEALRSAHELGIVHRDVKPHNLLIDAHGQVKLCDFGIATSAGPDASDRRTDARSPRYASPEQLDDEHELTPSSDVYSLGATLRHLVHGAPPTLRQRLVPPAPPPTDDAELAALDEVITACLAPDPDRRPTATEVLTRLRTLDHTLERRCRRLSVTPAPSGPAHDLPTTALAESGWDDPIPDDTSAPTVVRRDAPGMPRPTRPEHQARRVRWPYAVSVFTVAALVGAGAAWWRPAGSTGGSGRVPPSAIDI